MHSGHGSREPVLRAAVRHAAVRRPVQFPDVQRSARHAHAPGDAVSDQRGLRTAVFHDSHGGDGAAVRAAAERRHCGKRVADRAFMVRRHQPAIHHLLRRGDFQRVLHR